MHAGYDPGSPSSAARPRRLLGYEPEAWLAKPQFWQEKLQPEDAARAIQTCHDMVARREPYRYEYRMIAADGRTVWIRESGVVLIENDQPVAMRGIFQDITAAEAGRRRNWTSSTGS